MDFHRFAKGILREPFALFKSFVDRPLPADLPNFEYNKRYWDRYARSWDKSKVTVDDPAADQVGRAVYIEHLGDEWGRKDDVDRIVEEYIFPFVTPQSVVAEIGVGGGRIAVRVAGKVGQLYCFDISSEMLKRAKAALANHSNVRFVPLYQPEFPPELRGRFDFIYSFDVLVHLDLHLIWKYFQEIRFLLKEDGRAFIHTANLKSEAGWRYFLSYTTDRPEGFCFIVPEIVEIFAARSSLKVVKSSVIDPGNFYENRDYLVVLQK